MTAQRVTIEDVLLHNKLDITIDTKFVQEHLETAMLDIDVSLGTDFDISLCNYTLYFDECIKKRTYYHMLPYMNTFYQAEYPDMDVERSTFYLSPSQVKTKQGELVVRINELVEILIDDISTTYPDTATPNSVNLGGMIMSSAGGNPLYKPKYINDGVVENDS